MPGIPPFRPSNPVSHHRAPESPAPRPPGADLRPIPIAGTDVRLVPTQAGRFVNYAPTVPPSAAAPAPAPAHVPAPQPNGAYPPLDPSQVAESRFNGFKLMSPDAQESIRLFQAVVPTNVHGHPENPAVEHSQTFHRIGNGPIFPGRMMTGTEDQVHVGPDINSSLARVDMHTHPYTGRHNSTIPSTADHRVARQHPNLEHLVQVPAREEGAMNNYLTYSGSVPFRHYVLVPNPHGIPVRPPSPDGMTPFHPYPSAIPPGSAESGSGGAGPSHPPGGSGLFGT